MMEVAASAAAAVHGMLKSTHPIKGKWHKISAPPLARSSHSLSVVSGRAYIFGGETQAREPVDNEMHIIVLPSGTVTEADYKAVPARGGEVPEKRVGHTAAVIGERIFVFGGRGGKEMKPLQEKGRVWVYDTRTDAWEILDPLPDTPYPAPRSYHASVGVETPRPSKTDGGITEESEHGYGTLFIHAGCLESGRTNDLWGFDIKSCTWKEFPSAPGKPRGGTSLAVSKQRIFRFGGFNGEAEEGGQVDFLELVADTMSDISGEGQGQVAVSSRGSWQSLNFEGDTSPAEAGTESGAATYPGPRSVAGLHAMTTGMGREYLVLLLGERDASAAGHEGAGKFWSDVWALQVPPLGATGASIKDATWQALGRETGEGLWSEVYVGDAEGREGDDVRHLIPAPRGWFASAALGDLDAAGVVLWGGLNERNQREADGWILRLGS
ncbi:MAG: hypothetical protein M1818_002682 [Claussenomyces sp. TS43310]|nr:MAG: hypothetical protein M1818_002682 [Claussenomyces sp. TS43310]